jgi:hypothetical protein
VDIAASLAGEVVFGTPEFFKDRIHRRLHSPILPSIRAECKPASKQRQVVFRGRESWHFPLETAAGSLAPRCGALLSPPQPGARPAQPAPRLAQSDPRLAQPAPRPAQPAPRRTQPAPRPAQSAPRPAQSASWSAQPAPWSAQPASWSAQPAP